MRNSLYPLIPMFVHQVIHNIPVVEKVRVFVNRALTVFYIRHEKQFASSGENTNH